jgi:GT2 family glycosyltransferase
MDDWSDFPDVGTEQTAAETVLLKNADHVICTSQTLRHSLSDRLARESIELVPNGFDPTKLNAAQVRQRAERVVGFMGALAPWLDYELLEELITRMPDWSFDFVGDLFDPRARRLGRHDNVTLRGLLPHEDALAVAAHFTVGVIPFEDSTTTATVDPVKMYEYLALGVPTVARDLPQMRLCADHVALAANAAEFETRIRSLADATVPETTRAWLADQSWQARAEVVDPLLRAGFPRVSVVITSFGEGDLTVGCVHSILRHTPGFDLEILVVDNGSDPATLATLERGLNSPQVELIRLPENRGFAAACNVGLEASTGDVVVMLNNDTLVTVGWLTPLLQQLKRAHVGLVGPVTNSVGNEARRPLPGLTAANYCDLGRAYMADHAAFDSFDIPMLAFFCVAGRREVWEEVGPLSEEFGIGLFEDDDYAQRIRRSGRRLICTPTSYVFHYGQASFSRIDEQVYESLWKRNQELYEGRWGTWVPHSKRA